MRASLRLVLLAALMGVLGTVLWRNEEVRRSSVIRPTVLPPLRALSVVLSPERDFTLVGTDGRSIRLAAWQDRSPLVLSFFATDCHACYQELPSLRSLYDAYRSHGLKMALVSRESTGRLKEFASTQHIPFPVLSDPHHRLHETYGVAGTPFTMLIGRDGHVVGAPTDFFGSTQFEADFVPLVDAVFKRGSAAGA
jgi:peroxiredoxin